MSATEEMTGQELKRVGVGTVAARNEDWLEAVRREARRISTWKGHVTADDIRSWASQTGFPIPTHPNAWGAVFREPGWKPVAWKIAKRPAAHGRAIRVWTWIGPARSSEHGPVPQGELFP